MKKINIIFAFLLLFAVWGIAACNVCNTKEAKGLSSEQVTMVRQAINKDDFYKDATVEILTLVAEFDENLVVEIKVDRPDVNVFTVEVDVKVNGIYICSLPDPSYELIYYHNGEIYNDLQKAYDGGVLSNENVSYLAVTAKIKN